MSDNPGINDENNENYWESVPVDERSDDDDDDCGDALSMPNHHIRYRPDSENYPEPLPGDFFTDIDIERRQRELSQVSKCVMENDEKEGDNDRRQRKHSDVEVVDSDGNTIIGYISHIVEGPCKGTPLCNWFIIQHGSYPTEYIIKKDVSNNDVVITDL